MFGKSVRNPISGRSTNVSTEGKKMDEETKLKDGKELKMNNVKIPKGVLEEKKKEEKKSSNSVQKVVQKQNSFLIFQDFEPVDEIQANEDLRKSKKMDAEKKETVEIKKKLQKVFNCLLDDLTSS